MERFKRYNQNGELPADTIIFSFIGYEWTMDLSEYFFFNKSLARCKAVVKNALLYYYKNKEELENLVYWMQIMVNGWKKTGECPKNMEKFQKVIDYVQKEKMKYEEV